MSCFTSEIESVYYINVYLLKLGNITKEMKIPYIMIRVCFKLSRTSYAVPHLSLLFVSNAEILLSIVVIPDLWQIQSREFTIKTIAIRIQEGMVKHYAK